MFEVWEKKGGKSVMLARFKLEKDAQAHVDHYAGDGEVDVTAPLPEHMARAFAAFGFGFGGGGGV